MVGFPVWLWIHWEKTLITLMQPSAAQRVAVTRSRSWPAVAAALALHLIIDWKYSFNGQQLQSGCEAGRDQRERQRRAARRRRISVISVFLSSKDRGKLRLFRAGRKIFYFCRIYLQALMTFIQQSIFQPKSRQNASISNPTRCASQILLR